MKLLIVDDEQLTRDSLMKMIPWRSLGITEIQTAADGFWALQAAKRVPPDIVLCDVMMPRMDGMQFCKRLREFCPDCRIIFISGFASKEHLKEAISLRATRYIEKPILLEELEQAVRETVAQCRQTAENREEVNALRERQANVLPLLRRQMAVDFVQGSKTAHELQSEYGMVYHELSSAELYYSAYYRIRRQYRKAESSKILSIPTIEDELPMNRLEDASAYFKELGESIIVTDVPGRRDLAAFIYGSESETKRAIDAVNTFFAQLIAGKSHDQIALSLCGPVESITQLHPCCRLARTAAAWQAFRVPQAANILPFTEANTYRPDPNAAKTLRKLLDVGHTTAAHRFLLEWESKILEAQCGSVDEVRASACELFNVCVDVESRLSGVARQEKSMRMLHEALNACPTLSDLREKLDVFIDSLFPELVLTGAASPKVQQAVAHIVTQYQDKSLSAHVIARSLGVTTIYLCTIFKRETGKTIGQAIREVRVKRAKRLLETDMKVYEIADRVGYQDPNYFCTLFKRQTGFSTAEYRKEAQDPENGERQ